MEQELSGASAGLDGCCSTTEEQQPQNGREARGGIAAGLPSATRSRQSRRVSSAFACATFPYQRAESFGVRANVSRSHATSPKVGR